jgi:hypothetical protein
MMYQRHLIDEREAKNVCFMSYMVASFEVPVGLALKGWGLTY